MVHLVQFDVYSVHFVVHSVHFLLRLVQFVVRLVQFVVHLGHFVVHLLQLVRVVNCEHLVHLILKLLLKCLFLSMHPFSKDLTPVHVCLLEFLA